jgi:tRNA-2-methylthio-N6-dimethylallyladenosine synthase/ribosomal protein S12 methylthiotransferase
MGRPFAGNPWESVERIRSFFPEAALRTSLIAGFPGESEADFAALCAFVEKARFHHLGVFTYQREEGTPAADMPDQIPAEEKERRRAALMALQKEISAGILAQYAGQRLSILVDAAQGEWPGLHVGRAWFQAPENDGVTYVSGPGVVPGALVEAKITECADYDLVALAGSD